MVLKFKLIKPRPITQRFDILIAILVYPFILFPSVKLLSDAYDPSPPQEITNATFSFFTDHLNVTMLEPHTFKVLCPFIFIALHILFYFFTIWVIDFKVLVFYTPATESDATHVIFYPKLHRGHAEIVPFIRSDNTYAIYQQKRREYINGTFKSLKYPKNKSIKEYLESKGLSSSDSKEKEAYFGTNTYNIPVPSFKELLKEHITTPIFLFQIVSISAWMLDEYLIYPLTTLLSLVLIEANTVRTRQSNMLELRDIETKPIQMRVLRDGLWKTLPSDKLVPGDIVLLNSEIICPADMLVLSGRVVVNEAMLTGESTPQVKECVQTLDPEHKLDFSSDKRYILFGGTRIEQVLPEKSHIFTDQPGAVAYILATGLGSSQGSLLRTILFASERISYESNDSTKLILFLTFFALVASGYLLYFGWGNSSISTFALIINIIKIITSTIPSELPMHLTLQVNSSLLALSRLKVFCTEPFRIPFAGTISVCAFDKTGTLTAEDYNLLGIDEINNEKVTEQTINSVTGNFSTDCELLSAETQMVVGGCNSLVFGANKRLVGDQLEAAAFKALDFKFTTQTNIKNEKCKFQISKIFHFSAQLRRMTTVLTTMSPSKGFEVVTKGAPEVISSLLTEIPENYFETYKKYTKQGCRVLALAHKTLPSQSSLISLTREQCESELTFCGFAIFSAPLKKGTEDTIALLLKSTHRVVIITGDDPLTACHVAKRLHIINVDEFDNLIADEKYDEKCICYTGNCLQKLSQKELNEVCTKVNVFARMSPENKELVVHTLGNLGFNTMMCGDGTNDVNALKQANCGVGLLENSIETDVDEEAYRPKLGAASVASPFVSKRSTISACTDIIRFGRATLSGTIDLFKLLSLTSLITAYTSSVLFINNVKFGEFQMSIFALTMTVSYMSVSMSKPVRNLSPERPFRSQFNWYLVTSVLCQFAVHVVFLVLTRNLVFETGYKTPEFDSKIVFSPSLMNTAMFFISNAQQLATFISNYRGKPFMTPFLSNKALLWSCIATFALLFGLLFTDNEQIISYFQFVKFPTLRFRNLLSLYCFVDIVLCFVIEQILLFLFTLPMKIKSHDLVSKETLEKLKDYKFNDDDQLPENLHKFSFVDMLKENFQLQKNMLIRRIEAEKEEKLKNIMAKKSGLTKQEQLILKEYKQKIKKNAK